MTGQTANRPVPSTRPRAAGHGPDTPDLARNLAARLARAAGLPASAVTVRLTVPADHARSFAIAQATALLDGRRIRAQVTAGSARQALDMLGVRLRNQVTAVTRPWAPRPWPPTPAQPTRDPLTRTEIARFKTYPLTTCPALHAATVMDAMDYDIHLFRDDDTGLDTAIYRAGPTGYQLARLSSAPPPPDSALPLTLAPILAPRLTRREAADHLVSTGLAHLFFAYPDARHGAVLYRRHAGNYGLITGAR